MSSTCTPNNVVGYEKSQYRLTGILLSVLMVFSYPAQAMADAMIVKHQESNKHTRSTVVNKKSKYTLPKKVAPNIKESDDFLSIKADAGVRTKESNKGLLERVLRIQKIQVQAERIYTAANLNLYHPWVLKSDLAAKKGIAGRPCEIAPKLCQMNHDELDNFEKSVATLFDVAENEKGYDSTSLASLNQAVRALSDQKSKEATDQLRKISVVMNMLDSNAAQTAENADTIRRNKMMSDVLGEGLSNPRVTRELSPKNVALYTAFANHLKTGRNLIYIDKNVIEQIEKMKD